MKEVLIVDYNLGNIKSLQSALSFLGYSSVISNDPSKILKARKIILPGVGAFPTAIQYLNKYNLLEALKESAIIGNDILGICLGMQLFMNTSYEFLETKGLGFIDGDVVSINTNGNNLMKLPSIGWYKLVKKKEDNIFKQISNDQWLYFVHSFMVRCKNLEDIMASYKLGTVEITCVIKKNNITGFQFHPENSGIEGLTFLKNFCDE